MVDDSMCKIDENLVSCFVILEDNGSLKRFLDDDIKIEDILNKRLKIEFGDVKV